jgi:hypothetical protein
MGKVINEIVQFDPGFKQRLENTMLAKAPKLPEAETKLLLSLFTGKPLAPSVFKRCVRTIVRAMSVVPSYSISDSLVLANGEVDRSNSKVIRWSKRDIARDRFEYLYLTVRNIFS